MSRLLDGLNPAQQQAVMATEGPVLVLAGPGSGKTRVLTHRVAYLIQERGVRPWQVMAVTFTNKAANEMKERLAALLGNTDLQRLTIGTFHAICVRILRREADTIGLDSNFVIYDDSDQQNLVKQALKALDLDDKLYRPQAMLSIISRAKTNLLRPGDLNPRTYREEIAGRVYARYQAMLEENNALDFDDLLARVVFAFREHPALLEKYRQRYRYILVDEFQDTNAVQYELVQQLAGGHGNLFVVGDEDQCLVAGTHIATKEGPRPVESLRAGETVMAAAGHGSVACCEIDASSRRSYSGPVVVITTEAGRRLVATPEHCVFGRFQPGGDHHYVYLMYSHKLGYRIGRTGSMRTNGTKVYTGFAERLRQERGDAIWLLKACPDSSEAAYWEAYFAAQYGLPTSCFHASGRRLTMTTEQIGRLYACLDTSLSAERLAADLGISLQHPHHVPQATIRGHSVRKTISFTMFGGKTTKTGGARQHKVHDPWHLHELSICSSDSVFRDRVESVLPTKAHKQHYWIARRTHGDYDRMNDILSSLQQVATDARVWSRAKLTAYKYDFMPVGNLVAGALVPVLEADGTIGEDRVVSVEREPYDGVVYDLSVPIYRNYVAGGIVVHNSIYAFRGANFYNVLRFEQDYPDTTKILLEQNYRSTQTILDAANAVITPNTQRTAKKLFTRRVKGTSIVVHEAYDENEEGRWVVETIQALAEQGVAPGECAVMYRINAQSRALEDAFVAEGMPYKLVGATRFYARREIKDLLAYLRIIHNPYDTVSMMRVINVPPRKIGAKSQTDLGNWATANGLPLYEALEWIAAHPSERAGATPGSANLPLSAVGRKALLQFYELWKSWIAKRDQMTVRDLLDDVLEQSGYAAYIRDGSDEGQERWENVLELRAVAAEYDHLPVEEALALFLEEVSLVSDVDNLDETNAPTLLTLHSAKGLEFGVVFIVGLNDGMLPHSRSFDDPDGLEEERRLLYVGVTRAEDRLHLSHTFRRTIFGSSDLSEASRFLSDIPSQLKDEAGAAVRRATGRRTSASAPGAGRHTSGAPAQHVQSEMSLGRSRRSAPVRDSLQARGAASRREAGAVQPPFSIGDQVRHPAFGEGTVIQVEPRGDDWDLTVAFKGRGIKTLALGFARLEKVGR